VDRAVAADVIVIETRRFLAELRADGRQITGIVAPYHQPAQIGTRFLETFVPGSLIVPDGGVPLHDEHPSGVPHDESSMPITPPGEFAEGRVDGVHGMLGRWHAPQGERGDKLLAEIRNGQRSGLSAGFLPSSEDRWSVDRQRVTRMGDPLLHVAAVSRAAHPDARVLEVRASDLSQDERKALAAKGWALSDGSYPIPDAAHLHSAAILAASGHGNVEAARRLIKKRAAELGVELSSLPGFGSGTETRLSGHVAWDAILRRGKLIEAQERPYRTWAAVSGPAAARDELADRAVRSRIFA
jgi:phage head maturation protease